MLTVGNLYEDDLNYSAGAPVSTRYVSLRIGFMRHRIGFMRHRITLQASSIFSIFRSVETRSNLLNAINIGAKMLAIPDHETSANILAPNINVQVIFPIHCFN